MAYYGSDEWQKDNERNAFLMKAKRERKLRNWAEAVARESRTPEDFIAVRNMSTEELYAWYKEEFPNGYLPE